MPSEQEILDLIADIVGTRPANDTRLADLDGNVWAIILEVEDWLNICMRDEDVEKLSTVGEFIDYVQKRVKDAQSN